jgi:hypothetical protein
MVEGLIEDFTARMKPGDPAAVGGRHPNAVNLLPAP